MSPEPCPERYLEPRGDSGYRPHFCCLPVGHPGLHRTDTDEVVVWGSPGRIAQEDPCRLAVRAVTALLVELDEDVGDVGVRDDLRAVVRLLEGMPPPDHFAYYIDQQRRRLDAVADTAWRRHPERMLQVAAVDDLGRRARAAASMRELADDLSREGDITGAVMDLRRIADALVGGDPAPTGTDARYQRANDDARKQLAMLATHIGDPTHGITLPTILGAVRAVITTLEHPRHA